MVSNTGLILCRRSTFPILSVVPLIYGKTAVATGSSVSLFGRLGFSAFCISDNVKPFFSSALRMFFVSVCRLSASDNFFDLVISVLATDRICAGWWWDFAFKYLLVCVDFRYTVCPKVPSVFFITSTSRKANLLSFSVSIVNFMLSCCLLR